MEKVIENEILDILTFSSDAKAKKFTKIVVALIHDIEIGLVKDEKVFIQGMREINGYINQGIYNENSKIQLSITTSKKKIKLK